MENNLFDFYKKNLKKDPEYNEKLNLSYKKCVEELCNIPEWEEKIDECRYIFDPNTGLPLNSYTFILNFEDNIIINEIPHSYVFKRSHFYKSFDNKKSFLKKDLVNFWGKKGYFVRLHKTENNKWALTLKW